MNNYKEVVQSKLASLPVFSNTDVANIQLNPMKWRKGEKPLFQGLSLLTLIGLGLLLWFVVLPILSTMFSAFLTVLYYGIIGGSVLLGILARKPIYGLFKLVARRIHEAFIRYDPFGTFREQRIKLLAQEKEAIDASGIISQTKKAMQDKAKFYEEKAKSYQDRLLEIQQEATQIKKDESKYVTDEDKEDPNYADLMIRKNDLASEYSRIELAYNQSKSFVDEFGLRSNQFGKFEIKYKYFLSYIKNRVKNFDATVEMLQNDFEATSAMRSGTEAVKKVINFESEWEVKFASEVVVGAIANNLAITQNNLIDIKDTMGSFGSNMDSSKAFDKLDKLVNNINTGVDIIPQAKKYNNPELKLTAEDKEKAGGFNIF